jgi:hypothetical protein
MGSDTSKSAELPQPPANPANPFMHPGTPFTQTDLKVAQYITPETVGATMGSLAAPGIGTEGMPLLMRALAYAGPKVLGAAFGGGGGAALKEAGNPDSTRESITNEGINGAIRQAGAEVAGLGASAVTNRLLAPNIVPLRKLSEKAQEMAAFVPNTVSQFIAGLPEGSATRGAAESAQPFVTNMVQGAGHLIHAADKLGTLGDLAQGHLAAAAFGGPVGWSLAAGKQLLDPGRLMQYLTREPLSAGSQEAVRQLITGGIRASAAQDMPPMRPGSVPTAPNSGPKDDPFDALKPPEMAAFRP